MPLSNKQVAHIARLARLDLSEKEIEKYAGELTVIVDYFDQLRKIDTDGVETDLPYLTTENIFRDDVVQPSLPREAALDNAPESDQEYFHVPRVIGP